MRTGVAQRRLHTLPRLSAAPASLADPPTLWPNTLLAEHDSVELTGRCVGPPTPSSFGGEALVAGLSYDVFLSYARIDDENNQFVSKLAREMERAFQALTGRPLRIFLDTREIRNAQVWEERIKGALENSTVMVAVL